MRRDAFFWGAVLILLGGLMFLNAAGVQLPGGINAMQLFWPFLLIMAGLWVIMGVFLRGSKADQEAISIDLQGASKAGLRINHGAGHLTLGSGAPAGQLLSGSFGGGANHSARLTGDRLDARLEAKPTFFPFFNSLDGLVWDVALNRDVPLALRLETGASKNELDLRDLHVTDLRISTGASTTDLTLPANAGETTVKVEMGAASLDINVPQGVAARIRVQQGATAINVDTARFPYANGIYESADYSFTQNRADIKIEAGAGKVSIR